MAQDFVKGWISGHLRREERENVRAALARMGLQDDLNEWETLRWELLNWFVSFGQRDIATLSDEQCSQLDEEVQVIQLLASFNLNPWVPSREELQVLAKRSRTILSALVETGSVRIGPLPVEFVVWRGTVKQKNLPDAQQPKGVVMVGGLPSLLGHPPAEGIAFQVPPVGEDALIHCLAQLLSKYPGSVHRCPLCKQLFAQFRSSAKFCSRACQSQAWANEQYLKKKEAKEKRKSKVARSSSLRKAAHRTRKKVVRKGKGRTHGTKRRKR
jgi:hypothetical protein